MNKKLFVILIVLMSLSLIGIVFLQLYWINDAYKAKEDQFTVNVRQVLLSVSKKIQLKEVEEYYKIYSSYLDTLSVPDNVSFTELAYRTRNNETNETQIFTDGLLEQDFKLSSGVFDMGTDSIRFRKLTNRKTQTKVMSGLDGSPITQTNVETFTRLKDYERNQFESFIGDITAYTPIYKRISPENIEDLMIAELDKNGMDVNFEFAVYSNGIETKVRSENYKMHPESTYIVPLFVNDTNSSYELYVDFPNLRKVIFDDVMAMTILSLIFTSIIVIAYGGAISQIYKQRQISQIKSDFINNMTHEFKTPIATINLVLDSLKNPKIREKSELVDRYLTMIRDENKRMHAQVENVLRISKLEKNELDLQKEPVDLKEITEDAINHLILMVENSGGYIKTHFGALKNTVWANRSHLTNVIINILDNAIKYSTEEPPKIDVYTENSKDKVILKIRDQGPGMSKVVQKRIFEKFYREHTGDIHNVKGHGLGLAYVKSILDDHDAEITVESEKGKGSTFIIKLHLIS